MAPSASPGASVAAGSTAAPDCCAGSGGRGTRTRQHSRMSARGPPAPSWNAPGDRVVGVAPCRRRWPGPWSPRRRRRRASAGTRRSWPSTELVLGRSSRASSRPGTSSSTATTASACAGTESGAISRRVEPVRAAGQQRADAQHHQREAGHHPGDALDQRRRLVGERQVGDRPYRLGGMRAEVDAGPAPVRVRAVLARVVVGGDVVAQLVVAQPGGERGQRLAGEIGLRARCRRPSAE